MVRQEKQDDKGMSTPARAKAKVKAVAGLLNAARLTRGKPRE